jgi:hypothetical protein
MKVAFFYIYQVPGHPGKSTIVYRQESCSRPHGVCFNLCTCFNCQIGRYGTPNSLELEDEDEIDSS